MQGRQDDRIYTREAPATQVHSRYVYMTVHSRYVWEVSPHRHEFATKRPLVDVESRGGWADLRKDSTWGENLTLL